MYQEKSYPPGTSLDSSLVSEQRAALLSFQLGKFVKGGWGRVRQGDSEGVEALKGTLYMEHFRGCPLKSS